MLMLLMLLAVAILVSALVMADAVPSRGATVDKETSARLIAAARLQQFEDERQERFHNYHRAWAAGAVGGGGSRAPRSGPAGKPASRGAWAGARQAPRDTDPGGACPEILRDDSEPPSGKEGVRHLLVAETEGERETVRVAGLGC